MPIAFVCMSTEIQKKKDTLEALKKIGGVEEAYIISGFYDIIAKVVAEDKEKINEIIRDQIRKIETVFPASITIFEVVEN